MKILLPYIYPNDETLDAPFQRGGIEKFCKHLYDTFDIEVFYIQQKSLSLGISEKNKIAQTIINTAENKKVDIIISNFTSAVCRGNVISKSHIPIMIIEHTFYALLSWLSATNKLIKNGHSLFYVSKKQDEHFTKMANRMKMSPIKPTGYINPSFVQNKKIPLLPLKYDCGTIGRCSATHKHPFRLHELLDSTDLKSLVITSKPYVPDPVPSWMKNDMKYYDKNKHWENTLWDLDHPDILKSISTAATYYSTWPTETWGISALEALSVGVPLILNGGNSGSHASSSIASSESHYKIIKANTKELVDAIKSFKIVDRKEIQDMTIEKHSHKNWKDNFSNAIDMTIEKFKNDRNSNPYIK